MIKKKNLEKLYLKECRSMQEIANMHECSLRKIQYWIQKHNIPTRSISEAIYHKHNPNGDPFIYKPPKTKKDLFLFGLGLGLYWGEGTKSNRYAVRLGNTDPALIATFMNFMIRFFSLKSNDFRFELQIFSDLNEEKVVRYWIKRLKIKRKQFGKVVVTISGSIGNYRKKSEHGVLTMHYNNTKLRKLLTVLMQKHLQ